MRPRAPTLQRSIKARMSAGRDLLPTVARTKSYQPQKWTAFHRHVVALEMAGYRPGEIAQIVGIDPSRVSVILNDPRAQHDRNTIGKRVAEKVTDVHVQLKLHAPEALEVLREGLSSADEKVAQKSAIAILDRAGFSKYQGEHIPKSILPEDAARRIEAAVSEIKALPGTGYVLVDDKELRLDPEEEDDD